MTYDRLVYALLTFCAGVLALGTLACLARAVRGPSTADRLIAVISREAGLFRRAADIRLPALLDAEPVRQRLQYRPRDGGLFGGIGDFNDSHGSSISCFMGMNPYF